MNFFPSRYPIVEAWMNGASDLNLAAAVADAGAFPSLMVPEDDEQADAALTEFRQLTGHCDVLIMVPLGNLNHAQIVKVLTKHRPSHIELFRVNETGERMEFDAFANTKTDMALKLLKRHSKLMIRTYQPTAPVDLIDAFCLKGTESGGRTGDWSVKDLFDHEIQQHTSTGLIPYGGVGTPQQVAYYINQGAAGVAVGTLFAACQESPLTIEVKNKMIAASSQDLQKTANQQNFLQLGEEMAQINDGWNRTQQLTQSIKGDGEHGFVYAGKSVDHVDRMRTAKEVVEYLVSELDL